mgnify:CR=1 FL=1
MPDIGPMQAAFDKPPESRIGERISAARKGLSLSVEALARFTTYFDPQEKRGISPTSLLRYESGEFEPGARELRILCDTLCVPPGWLLYGSLENAGDDSHAQRLLNALEQYVVSRSREIRFDGEGVLIRRMYWSTPTIEQRRAYFEKAKSGKKADEEFP